MYQLIETVTNRLLISLIICPRRLTERPGGYDPSDARSSRAGDAAAVAELAMQRLVVPLYTGSSPVSRLKISFFRLTGMVSG